MPFIYSGHSNLGVMRELNEDYISTIEPDANMIFSVIGDGAGSKTSSIQPASICASEMNTIIDRSYLHSREYLIDNAEHILGIAMHVANRVLGAFKNSNIENYSGFGSSVTCVLAWDDGNFAFAHTGNTRLYLIRPRENEAPIIRQFTRDQTLAQRLLDEGKIDNEQYYAHPDRLSLLGGLGIVVDPEIQTFSGKLRNNDFLLLTTDGIHYAIRPEAISEIVMASDDVSVGNNLVEAAKTQDYPDNMSALLIWYRDGQ